MGRDVSAEGGLVSQNADYAPVSAVSNRGKMYRCTAKREQMRDRIKTYVGVLRDNTPLSPRSHCSFSGWGLPFRCLTSLSTGLLNPASWPLGSLSLSATPWGTSLPFCGTAKSRLFFCGEDSSFLCALLWQQVITIDIASSWNTDFFGSVSRVAYVGSILMCLGTTLIVVMTASIVAQIGARNTLLVSVAGMLGRGNAYGCLGLYGSMGQRHCSPFCSAGDDPR